MCDLRKGFDLPQCICNKAPRPNFKGPLFNLHHHRAYSKPHNIASSSPRLAYISIWLTCLVRTVYIQALSWKQEEKRCRILSKWAWVWKKEKKKKTLVRCVPPSASFQTRDLFDCHPLNHTHLLISSWAKSWHMWLYIEYKDQITLAAFQLLSSKLYIAALHHSRQNERKGMLHLILNSEQIAPY